MGRPWTSASTKTCYTAGMRNQAISILLCGLLAACTSPAVQEPSANGTFVRDTARVVSIDPALGQVVLDLHGKQVKAFWETETLLAQEGSIRQPDEHGLRGPVGQYKEPVIHPQDIGAKEGDMISFRGMWTGDRIFLRGVTVVQ